MKRIIVVLLLCLAIAGLGFAATSLQPLLKVVPIDETSNLSRNNFDRIEQWSRTLSNQLLLTTSSPTFAGLTVTGTATFAAVNLGDTNLSDYKEGTFPPIVTLVGGAGNTVPVYTTNEGRYTRIGNRCFVEIYLTGDGGAEGAGTGTINIALPIAASASASQIHQHGYAYNSTTEYQIELVINASATTVILTYWSSVSATASFTGAMQNNTSRSIRISFWYEV